MKSDRPARRGLKCQESEVRVSLGCPLSGQPRCTCVCAVCVSFAFWVYTLAVVYMALSVLVRALLRAFSF